MGEGSGNSCDQVCVNTPGGFNCSCNDGFELINDTQCRGRVDIRQMRQIATIHYYFIPTDFDECMGEGSGNECEQGCVNYPGGFNCSCPDGFGLINGVQCQGI